jgi:hypothetical protein
LCACSSIAHEADNWSDGVFRRFNGIGDSSHGAFEASCRLRESCEWREQEQSTSGTIAKDSPRYGCQISDFGDKKQFICQ